MIISISSTSIVIESGVETPSPMPIMEDTAAFVPLTTMVVEEVEHIPFIPEVRLGPDPANTSKRKWSSICKKVATPPPEAEELGSASMQPDYIPPHLADPPKIKIMKNEKYLLVKSTV